MKVDGVEIETGDKVYVREMTRKDWDKLSWWQKIFYWRLLFKKDEPNGVYKVTETGSAGKPWIAERNREAEEERCPICGGYITGGHERDGSQLCWGHDVQ